MRKIDLIQTVYIEKALADGPVARYARDHVPAGVAIEIVDDPRQILTSFRRAGEREARDALLLYSFPGTFLSSCPGSDGMVCCNYFVINLGVGCLFDCHYCYLQNFLNNPLMTVHANLDQLFSELDFKTRNKKVRFRIGTGEYTDSLVLEPLTGLSSRLVEYFARSENALLELKTKSSNVESLLDLDHRGHTVMAWSVNPPRVVAEVEDGTASLDERLAAARLAAAAGYKIAFHLDPVIYYEEWETEYHALIERLFDEVPPDSIVWISLGSFRFAPGLKERIQARFPADELTRAEMVQGTDGKYRYFKTIRSEMYVSIRKKIAALDPRQFLYLCMETRRMWEQVTGHIPESARRLDAGFEERRQYVDARTQGSALVPVAPGRA